MNVSYWSGTCSLALRQEHNVFDNSSPTLSKTLGFKSYTVTGWDNLQNKKLHHLYSSSHRVIK